MVKFAEKFLNMMTLNDSDEELPEEFEGEYEEVTEDTPEQPAQQHNKPILSFRRKKKEQEEEEPEEEPAAERRVIPFHGRQEEGEVVKVVKPQLFNEARVVAEFLKDGITVVVNLEGIEIGEAQRIADFVGGACFAIDGTLKAISNNIFIVAPGNIEVSGDLRDEIISDSMLSPELTKF